MYAGIYKCIHVPSTYKPFNKILIFYKERNDLIKSNLYLMCHIYLFYKKKFRQLIIKSVY